MRFKDLLEQDQLRRALFEDLTSDAASHAYLITGPAGSGKKTWGKVLACALLCRNRLGAEPCLSCVSCRSFDAGNHPAYYYLEPESKNIKIEQIREIRRRFYYQGENRVCLIWRAELMTAEAASSLLKILEDPPHGLYFILLAEHIQQLFSTIVSRCKRFLLQPLTAGSIGAILEQYGTIRPEKKELAVRMSKGLPGAALTIAHDLSYEEKLQGAFNLAACLICGRLTPRETVGQAVLLSESEDLLFVLELLYLYYREVLFRQLGYKEALLINSDWHTVYSEGVSPGALISALEIILSTRKELALTNVNRRLSVEGMLIELQRRFSYA